jgi:hypothetical protein
MGDRVWVEMDNKKPAFWAGFEVQFFEVQFFEVLGGWGGLGLMRCFA